MLRALLTSPGLSVANSIAAELSCQDQLTPAGPDFRAKLRDMPVPLALVHSPLVGPGTWDAVTELIQRRGRDVLVPDLRDTLADGSPYWSRQVDVITAGAAGQHVILVGHSGAGPLLAAAGLALDRIGGYVFMDAGLPCPGQSRLSRAPSGAAEQLRAIAKDGWLPPWSQWWDADGLAELLPNPKVREQFAADCPLLPMAMFEEVEPSAAGWPDAPCAYLRLSESYQDDAERAKALGWPVTELRSNHLAMLNDPEQVVDALLELARQLEAEPPASAR